MAIGAGSLALLFFFFFGMAAYRDIDLTLYTDLPDPSLAVGLEGLVGVVSSLTWGFVV